MTFSPLEQNLWALSGLILWVLAYILMFRRGLLDKSYGMPMVALCLNVAWEAYFSLFSDAQLTNRVAYGLYLVVDLGVLWTCWQYGAADFRSSLIQRYFQPMLVAVLIGGFFLIRQFSLSFADGYGGISATFTTLFLSVALVGMLLRRNSVRGQSLYIGLLVLVGNIAGWMMNLIAKTTVAPNISVPWVMTTNTLIILANVIYLVLFIHVARRDGINIWRRL
ncbi:MAG: hypothetical protein Tsb002_26960 [Wenzhouxiangellaceae bacterium]